MCQAAIFILARGVCIYITLLFRGEALCLTLFFLLLDFYLFIFFFPFVSLGTKQFSRTCLAEG